MEEVAGELTGVGGDEGFEVVDVLEGAAIEELAGGVHGGGEGVAEAVSGAVDAGDAFSFFQASIVCAPAAKDVEVFQRKANGIKPRVAGGARFGFSVQREQFANRFGTADVRLHGGHARWRCRWWLADEALHHPGSTHDGRGRRAVGADFQHSRLGQQATERTVLGQAHFTHGRASEWWKLVVFRKAVIGEDEVRFYQGAGRQVIANHRREESASFALHAFYEVFVKAILGEEADVGIVPAEVAEIEPAVGEVFHEAIEASAGDEAFGFCAEYLGIAQLFVLREVHEPGVGT